MARPIGRRNAGITCIELTLLILYIWAFILGAQYGWDKWADDGLAWRLAGGALGGLSGVVCVMLGLLALFSPIWLYFTIKRALSPANLTCHCAENDTPIPSQLSPAPGIGAQAFEQSHTIGGLNELAPVHFMDSPSNEELAALIANSSSEVERLSIAAHLGVNIPGVRVAALGDPPISYKNWATTPNDLQAALRSGLPPRLILAFGIACFERALPIFEKEFHQDTRPRQILGASTMILLEGGQAAAGLCRDLSQGLWTPDQYGCRVVSRNMIQRIWDVPTPGHNSALAALQLAWLGFQYVSPDRLWATYDPHDMRRGYETEANRIAWCQPSWSAEAVCAYSAQASGNISAEYEWQRRALARLILGWSRWEEDRGQWVARIEGQWLPLIRNRIKEIGYDEARYTGMIRARLAPW